MRRVWCFLIVIGIAGCAIAQPAVAPARIGTSSVWQIPPQFLANAHAVCDKLLGDIGQCLIDQMAKNGASPDAVAFSRELYKQSHGDVGIMTGFQPIGPVDFGYITYPLRANTNYGLVLVNGSPRIVNVEDLNLLDEKTMQQSAQFQDLKGQFPQVALWPGDRDGKIWPNSQAGPNGGTQFVLDYPLINGCHACARAGRAIFTWNFDAHGKFLGTSFQGLTPPPLPQ